MRRGAKKLLMVAVFVLGAAYHTCARDIRFGIYVLNLGKFDMSSGSFTADFYLSLKSDEPISDNSFEFMNGRAASVEKLEASPDGKEVFYRILANLSTPTDLRRFPFDTQTMQILIEDKTNSIEKVRFVPDEKQSGLDEGIVFPGWEILGYEMSTREHYYPAFEETYSQIVFSIHIGRIKVNAFLKTFLPVLFLMLIVMSSFILNPNQIATRLAAVSSALVTSAMFHISISNQIPAVGYLTFADKFMVLTYFILLACFALSLYVFILQERKDQERAKRINKITERIVFTGMPLLYLLLFLLIRR
ncbi:MAG: hypothetical protein N2255_10470 [Kiritimatiellae bacterium]|nr:hypothetical protein [Kiritimatiellia bacterium]